MVEKLSMICVGLVNVAAAGMTSKHGADIEPGRMIAALDDNRRAGWKRVEDTAGAILIFEHARRDGDPGFVIGRGYH